MGSRIGCRLVEVGDSGWNAPVVNWTDWETAWTGVELLLALLSVSRYAVSKLRFIFAFRLFAGSDFQITLGHVRKFVNKIILEDFGEFFDLPHQRFVDQFIGAVVEGK